MSSVVTYCFLFMCEGQGPCTGTPPSKVCVTQQSHMHNCMFRMGSIGHMRCVIIAYCIVFE